ncbi:MAG: diacylglycerol kinase family protein [Candidatus Parcubacteria bacterium]|nr:diacylglycerol kinase family protein [Candidatus Parcubacteria bacterium]
MVSIRRLIKSFKYSLSGIAKVFKEEQNFRIHTLATILVLALAFYFKVSVLEFIILLILVSWVLILEIVNSIIERLLDMMKPRLHSYVEDIKDMAASIVFISAGVSALIGLLIFLPYILARIL